MVIPSRNVSFGNRTIPWNVHKIHAPLVHVVRMQCAVNRMGQDRAVVCQSTLETPMKDVVRSVFLTRIVRPIERVFVTNVRILVREPVVKTPIVKWLTTYRYVLALLVILAIHSDIVLSYLQKVSADISNVLVSYPIS